MACSCSKNNNFTAESPLILGEPTGEPAQKFRSTITFHNMKVGSTFWATGSGVQSMIHSTWIVPISD